MNALMERWQFEIILEIRTLQIGRKLTELRAFADQKYATVEIRYPLISWYAKSFTIEATEGI